MAVRFNSGIDYGQVGESIERDLQRAGQFVTAGFGIAQDIRIQEQKFANTVLENIESLKDEGDLAHQAAIAGKVDELYNKAKTEIYKYRTTKKGKVKFDGYDFDPETLRGIKNDARQIKNAALRSEQARQAYDQYIRVINADDTINQRAAIEALDAKFKDPSILFKGDSTSPDNIALAFSDIVEQNVNPQMAVRKAANTFVTGRTTDIGVSTADGRSEVVKYNVDYLTPNKFEQGKMTSFTWNEDKLQETAAQMRASRPAMMRMSQEEVVGYLKEQLDPLRQLRYAEPKREVVKPTEADTKRLLEANRYQDTVKAFQGVGSIINKGEYPSAEDYARISRSAGKEALKNIEFVNLKDIKEEYNQGEESILEILNEINKKEANKGFGSKKKLITEFLNKYNESKETVRVTGGLEALIKEAEDKVGKDYEEEFSKITDAYSNIQPLQDYVTKDFGILVKDKRGKDTKRIFVESSNDLTAFSSTVFDVPLTFSTEGQQQTRVTGELDD